MPAQVATYVKSETQSLSGAGALNSLFTRSSGRGAALSLIVILTDFPRTIRCRPIRRATVHRATPLPSRPGCRQTFLTP